MLEDACRVDREVTFIYEVMHWFHFMIVPYDLLAEVITPIDV